MKRWQVRAWLELLVPVAVIAMVISTVISGCGCASRRIRPPRGVKMQVVTMEVTGYDDCGQCCNWKRTWLGRPVIASGPQKGTRKEIGVTASGTDAKYGTIAADTRYYPFGTVMYVEGYGYGRVEDRGGAIKGPRKIDLYFDTHKKALKWGRQRKNVKVWIVRR